MQSWLDKRVRACESVYLSLFKQFPLSVTTFDETLFIKWNRFHISYPKSQIQRLNLAAVNVNEQLTYYKLEKMGVSG